MKKKAVVTGGAGFIGHHLCKALLDDGYEVVAVDTLVSGFPRVLPEGVVLHKTDIRDTAAITEIFKGADVVFHTAALPRVQYSIEYPVETHDVNINGTLSVLLAARDAKVRRVVYSASSSAYGDQTVMPLVETMPTNPISPYAVHKYVGEVYASMFAHVFGLETVSLRYFNVYGLGADPHGAYALVTGKFIQQRVEGKPMTITGDGSQTRDFTHIRDVVRANMLAATKDTVGHGEVMNIGAGHGVSINEIARLIGGPIEYVAPRLEPHDTTADNRRAKELLGWAPTVAIEEGIAELKREANLE